MGYLLLDKFRGAWLGSIIAQELVNRNPKNKLDRQKNQSDRQLNYPHKEQSWLLWSIREMESTLNTIKDKPHLESEILDLWWYGVIDVLDRKAGSLQVKLSSVIILMLPILLYYHDRLSLITDFIDRQTESSLQFPKDINNVLVWCYVIRLALRGELNSYRLTERVVMGTGLQQKSIILWLELVEMSCVKGLNPMELIAELSPMVNLEIPLSLFCFLNNPEDFYLTIQQALSLENQAENTTVLSSAISGAYNSLTGIPIDWRNSYLGGDCERQIKFSTEEMINRWLGCDLGGNNNSLYSVIGATKTLQPRSQLKIISQREYESN